MPLHSTSAIAETLKINHFETFADYQSVRNQNLIDDNELSFIDEQIQSDWAQTNSNEPDFIKNKPELIGPGTLTTTAITSLSTATDEPLSGSVKLHKVSKTGNYNDLVNKPTIRNGVLTIQTGATPNLNNSFSANQGENTTITLHKVVSTGKVGDLTNDANYITSAVTAMTNYATSANVVTELNKKPEIFECEITFTPNTDNEDVTTFPTGFTFTCNQSIPSIISAATSGKVVKGVMSAYNHFSDDIDTGISLTALEMFDLEDYFWAINSNENNETIGVIVFKPTVAIIGIFGVQTINFTLIGVRIENNDEWTPIGFYYSEDLDKVHNLKDIATGGTLNDISDVQVFNASSGQVLQYNGQNWVNGGKLSDYLPLSGGTLTGDLYINKDTNASGTNSAGSLVIGTKTGVNVAIDANEIMARSNNTPSNLYINNDGGNILMMASGSSSYNVGLGTSSPTSRLHVVGDILATTSVRASGNDIYIGSASTVQCHQQYDSTNKCLKFIFD